VIARARVIDGSHVADVDRERGAEHFAPVVFDPPVDVSEALERAVPAFAITRYLGFELDFGPACFSITPSTAAVIADLLRGRAIVRISSGQE
jgi:hypothetical protein